MNLDPQLRRAMTLWAEAEYAANAQQWDTAHARYLQALAIYEALLDSRAAYRTLYCLCRVAKQQEDWPRMVTYARKLLGYDMAGFFGRIGEARAWLLIGQAERQMYHTAAARHALVQSVRLSEAYLSVVQHVTDPTLSIINWAGEGCTYVEALQEWALLEAEASTIPAALDLMALSGLTMFQTEELTRRSSQEEEAELERLRKLIATDRAHLEERL